jgi:D-glycero-D-manno-heptose 1,7-bisphosphate phosphatase
MNPADGRPAAFLDRDGTIIVDRHYLSDPAGVELIPGAIEGLRTLRDDGYLLIVITNQSGIGRGLYDEAAYRAVHVRLEELLARDGISLDGAWFCPHHPEFGDACDCRKPGLRLFHEASETLGIDFRRSLFIGDRPHDVEPGLVLGGRPILVRTGYGREHAESVPRGVDVVADLRAAAVLATGRVSG